jgi:hypothetical protein
LQVILFYHLKHGVFLVKFGLFFSCLLCVNNCYLIMNYLPKPW